MSRWPFRIELITESRRLESHEKNPEERMNKLNNDTIKCIIQHGDKANE